MRILLLPLLLFGHMCLAQDLAKLVNPFVGTGGHGHTFPGATLPFGMVQLSPDTRIDGSWDGCSGYHYSDSVIYGFSHTHLSGTGVSDYGDVLLMPVKGGADFNQASYASKFSHQKEKASPGYYSVFLDEPEIEVELTASNRVGFHKYSAKEGGVYSVMLDLNHRDQLIENELVVVSENQVEGFRRSKAWAQNQVVYFSIEFSKKMISNSHDSSNRIGAYQFSLKSNEALLVKVGISFVSIDGARKNLHQEIPHWDFEKTKNEAESVWNESLNKIEVSAENPEKQGIFYTALYHCMMHPNLATDVDSNYLGHDGKVHKAIKHTQYTVFSLWDTYRALHPLLTIIDTKRTADFITSFLMIYEQGGRLPVWELCSNETDCMIGYHSVSVIADAYAKGITNFDTKLALKAMMASSNANLFGLPSYRKYGYVRAEDEAESVSKTLEYAYDDWCISEFTKRIGEVEIAEEYKLRSERWRNSLDKTSGFMTPRINDYWLPDFDPKQVNNHFTEANSWQYSFYVPQNIPGLIKTHGSASQFEQKLDQLFNENSQTTGREQSDITGLIGQYAHGNEPSHHIAYLYNYINRNDKTQDLVNRICDSFYTLKPDGLIGNEDCGQMSAWYVLSASGFYPVCPGSTKYSLGIPQFSEMTYHLDSGKVFKVENNSKINGSKYKKAHLDINASKWEAYGWTANGISHEDIISGEATLSFHNADRPFITRDPDTSKQVRSQFVETPLIKGKKVFESAQLVEILGSGKTIKYFTNLNPEVKVYLNPLNISQTTTVFAMMEDDFNGTIKISPTAEATFFKKQNYWTVDVYPSPNPQYTGGGEDALIDGIRGTVNWRAGNWQGHQSDLVEIHIKLDKKTKVSELEIGFLQDSRSWILMPTYADFSTFHFWRGIKRGASVKLDFNALTDSSFVYNLVLKAAKPRKTKHILITLKSAGKLPEGHVGHTMNGDSFIFLDEIIVR